MHVQTSGFDRLIARIVYAQNAPIIGVPCRILLRTLGVNIPSQARIGPGLMLPHATTGLVVHGRAEIGASVALLQNVTIGRAHLTGVECPDIRIVIGDRVLIGAGAVVLVRCGQTLHIGDDAVVGANAVITHDVGPGQVWAGNPARMVNQGPGHAMVTALK